MRLKNKDKQILEHIIKYCIDIHLAVEHFGREEKEFANNPVYMNACSMPLLQIGELAKNYLMSSLPTPTIFHGDKSKACVIYLHMIIAQ